MALTGTLQQLSLRCYGYALAGWEIAESLSLLWQLLAALAMVGILLVLVFAIIEPGPLVKKRPFPHRQRQPTAEREEPSGNHSE